MELIERHRQHFVSRDSFRISRRLGEVDGFVVHLSLADIDERVVAVQLEVVIASKLVVIVS